MDEITICSNFRITAICLGIQITEHCPAVSVSLENILMLGKIVSSKVFLLCKAFVTIITKIRSLSSMNKLMSFYMLTSPEVLWAILAFISGGTLVVALMRNY